MKKEGNLKRDSYFGFCALWVVFLGMKEILLKKLSEKFNKIPGNIIVIEFSFRNVKSLRLKRSTKKGSIIGICVSRRLVYR